MNDVSFKKIWDTQVHISFVILTIVFYFLQSVQLLSQEGSSQSIESELQVRLRIQDTDLDGIPDIQENQLGLDPDDPMSRELRRLSFWDFNSKSFSSDSGQRPNYNLGAIHRIGMAQTGLSLDPEFSGSRFHIPYANPEGSINIASNNGTMFFYFRPDWDSGDGPGDLSPLISTGLWTSDAQFGYWGLTVSPDGKSIFLGVQKGGKTQKTFETAINWKKGQWYLIRFTWGPTYSALFVDHEKVATSGVKPLPLTPDPNILKRDGLDLLGNRYGHALVKGSIDELEIYNYGMGINNVKARYTNLVQAHFNQDENTIQLDFPSLPNKPVKIFRRHVSASEWDLLEEKYPFSSYTDDEVELDRIYEYKVEADYEHNYTTYLDRMILVSTGSRTREADGTLLIIVDQTLADSIREELLDCVLNWIEDGWSIIMIQAPRHLDKSSQIENHANVLAVKNKIKEVAEESDLKSVVLVGHVSVPYSGRINPDGHGLRPWETDLFYGDLIDDQKWTDRERDNPTIQNARVPEDGIMDPYRFPSPIEIAVGRIDFSNLPVFEESEIELTKRYLKKINRYRDGELRFNNQIASFSSFPHEGLSRTTHKSALRNGGALVGNNLSHIYEVNFFHSKESYIFGVQLGAGYHDTISNGNPVHQVKSIDLAKDLNKHQVGFLILDGSYFGAWNTRNNFLRSSLTMHNGGLTSIWGRYTMVRMHWMAGGMTVGESLVNNVNSLTFRDGKAGFSHNNYIQLMGDPTLSIIHEPPVSEFEVKTDGSKNTLFVWKGDKSKEVFIEYSTDGPLGKFNPVSNESIVSADNQYSTNLTFESGTIFRIRKVLRKETYSGDWVQLSHGTLAQPGSNNSEIIKRLGEKLP